MYYLNSYEKKQKLYYVRKQTKQIALKRMSFSDYHGWLLSWLQSLVLMIKLQHVIFLISHVSYCIILLTQTAEFWWLVNINIWADITHPCCNTRVLIEGCYVGMHSYEFMLFTGAKCCYTILTHMCAMSQHHHRPNDSTNNIKTCVIFIFQTNLPKYAKLLN